MFIKTEKQVKATKLHNKNTHVMLWGGARSGKTAICVRNMIIRACKVKSRHLIARLRFNHIKQSIAYDTLPSIMELCFPTLEYKLNKSDWFVKLPNGSEIWLAGLDENDRIDKILGTEYSTIFLNECTQISWEARNTVISRLAENTGLDLLAMYDCNPTGFQHWAYTVFMEGKSPEKEDVIGFERYANMQMNPADNLENLPEEYVQMLEGLPKRQRDRFLHGLFLDSFEGALWTREIIKYDLMSFEEAVNQCVKLVIAIDPAVTAHTTSDETGLIVAGKKIDGTFLVIADYSGQHRADEWAKIAVNLYHKYKADYIVAEVNQGGDLVERSVKFEDNTVKFKQVRATRGKFIRAEPIAGLYERGLVKHIKEFNILEDQMCQFVPENMIGGDDRIDANVWGLTELADAQEIQIRIR